MTESPEETIPRLLTLAKELEKPGCNVYLAPAAAAMLRDLVDAIQNQSAGERREPRESQPNLDDERVRAEALWEELGGDLCICQRPDVPHWCENCQRRIGLIQSALRRVSASCALPVSGGVPLDALREIARLRLATDEGSLRVRADKMWEIATGAIAKANLG